MVPPTIASLTIAERECPQNLRTSFTGSPQSSGKLCSSNRERNR